MLPEVRLEDHIKPLIPAQKELWMVIQVYHSIPPTKLLNWWIFALFLGACHRTVLLLEAKEDLLEDWGKLGAKMVALHHLQKQ